jgi:hypothetical protein
MNTKSNGPIPSASILGNVASAAPVLISTLSPRPARATFRRATSACLALTSSVMSRPSSGKARASQIVE